MDNRQLQIFHQVAKWCSFTRAAKALHMAQPAVSIAIKKLERELDVVLFNRVEKKVELTYEGRVLLLHAERILAQFQQAQLEIAELRGLEAGEVRLGTSVMLGCYYFPEKIARFRQLYPNVRVQVIGEGTQRSQQLIQDDEIDVGVVNLTHGAVGAELESHPLVREEVVVCVPRDHALAGRRRIPFAALAEQNLIVYREGYYLREIIDSLSLELGTAPRIVVETNLLRLMINLVQAGEGVSICLRRMAEQEPGLVGVSFEQPVLLSLGIAWKRNQYLSKASRAFVDFLLQSRRHGNS